MDMNGTIDFSELKLALIDWDKELKKKLLVKTFKFEDNCIQLMSLKHQFSTILPHEWNQFTKKVKEVNGMILAENLKAYIKYTLE